MKHNNTISRITVRLKVKVGEVEQVLGTGVIYYQEYLDDKVYILTAAHCLYQEEDKPMNPYPSITIDFFNQDKNEYVAHKIDSVNFDLISKDLDKDVAVIVLDKSLVEGYIGQIPEINIVKTRQSTNEFIVKGFPNATQGKELAVIYPLWLQEMTVVPKFQLLLNEDYTEYHVKGFSGGGVFFKRDDTTYLYGIFTRYREEEKGKVIYCQYIESINKLLQNNYLPTIRFSYFGGNNLTQDFFKKHIQVSLKNLGPRFSKELNVKLPISMCFNDLVRDEHFQYRFLNTFDTWLSKHQRVPAKDSPLFGLFTKQNELREDVLKWLRTEPWIIPQKINIEWIFNRINKLSQSISSKISELYDEQEKLLAKEKNKENEYRKPFDEDISNLRRLSSHNYTFESDFNNEIQLGLTNYPVLLLKGEAGSGKSHLLGDIALNRLNYGLPSLLLLGQHFKTSKTVQKNILELLDIDCSFEVLLQSLNEIGKQIGGRVPIFIDALNEGAGAGLWSNEFAGFVESFELYPYVALVMSVRTTYVDVVLPEDVDPQITQRTHQGFKGNEYAALQLFCEYYGLRQPDFPILSPEFTQPLFLILLCKGVENSLEKTFPQGFQGIGKIFEYYLDALEKQFSKIRDEYKLSPGLLSEAIKKYSLYCFEKNEYMLSYKEATQFFREQYPYHKLFLLDCIQEGVFIRNRQENYETGNYEEVLYFAYERFGDYLIANEILDAFSTQKELIAACSEEERLGILISNFRYRNRGLIEALAIAIPERFNLELFEVFKWLYGAEHENEHSQESKERFLSDCVMQGIKWRQKEGIDNEKISEWFRSDFSRVTDDQFLSCIVELATIKDHPFNSDRWHKLMKDFSMPDRDGFLQEYLRWNSVEEDDYETPALRRLIDWAWSPKISMLIDKETAILTSQILVWVLASTFRQLRDETTKALVNLLSKQSDALIEVLIRFRDVDDMYIQERLYAVAYGCILRTTDDKAVGQIGMFVYKEIFEDKNPPDHILLRDYAKNTVEFMLYKQLGESVDVKKIKPPFKSRIPTYPTEEEITQFDMDYDNNDLDKDSIRAYNRIHFSVMLDDFGRKTVTPQLRDFYPISFIKERKYKDFLRRLSQEKREHLETLSDFIHYTEIFQNKKKQFGTTKEESKILDEFILGNTQMIEKMEKSSIDIFPKKIDYIQNEVLPYLVTKKGLDEGTSVFHVFDTEQVKRWMVKRAFDLGYDVEKHGQYDKQVFHSQRFGGNTVEFIGKKYLWIAYHEILSVLTDNHKVEDDFHYKKYKYYKGAHTFYVRDIDPVYITKDSVEKVSDELGILDKTLSWWSPPVYNNWEEEDSSWIYNEDDFPDATKLILVKDDVDTEWLFLNRSVKWKKPKKIGVDRYKSETKDIWYQLQGYIIKKKDKDKTIKLLGDKNYWGRWMPDAGNEHHQLFNREKYWSPAYNQSSHQEWETVYYEQKSTRLKVVVSFEDAKGQISEDKSGAHVNYNIPCKLLFKGLGLEYSDTDGVLEDINGEVITKNIPKDGLIIKKDELLDYLEKNDLEIVWTLLGEKMVFQNHSNLKYFCELGGLFYLNDQNQIEGHINRFKRD